MKTLFQTLTLSLTLLVGCADANFEIPDVPEVPAPKDDSGSTATNDTGATTEAATEKDAGSDTDTGSGSDTGSDAGSDTGTADDGPSTEAGTDSGTEAAPPPECTGDILGCFASQPKVCVDGKWTASGGVCSYTCTAGKCACSEPGRFTKLSAAAFKDTKTGLTWYPASNDGSNYTTLSAACPVLASGAHIPTKAQVLGLLAQQNPVLFCDPNVDTVIQEMVKPYEYPGHPTYTSQIWTSDTTPDGKKVTVTIKTGMTGALDPATVTTGLVFCVK